MSLYFHLRAVPPPALRNSATWLERLFGDDSDTARHLVGRHREEVLDNRCLDQELLYAGDPPHRAEDRPQAQVVLGGRPVFHPDRYKPPFLVLTAGQTHRVARFLTTADFDTLWAFARDELLPRYGGVTAEPDTRGVFAAAHRELTEFYAQTAACGDAVVKWLPARSTRHADSSTATAEPDQETLASAPYADWAAARHSGYGPTPLEILGNERNPGR
ncbi:YfbM family protein [Streptomyces sp. NBC_00075]|uniref:DUF1877 family protein n=1 Tax=Streptomyces sp. NBC_00075 TaxID=2975641 RepID=UPI003246A765